MVKTMVSGVDFPLNQSIDLWIPIRHVPQVPWTASHRSVGTAQAVDAIVIPSCGLDIFSRVYPIYISYMYIYIHIMRNIIYIYIYVLYTSSSFLPCSKHQLTHAPPNPPGPFRYGRAAPWFGHLQTGSCREGPGRPQENAMNFMRMTCEKYG